eukprot:ctg_810.g209
MRWWSGVKFWRGRRATESVTLTSADGREGALHALDGSGKGVGGHDSPEDVHERSRVASLQRWLSGEGKVGAAASPGMAEALQARDGLDDAELPLLWRCTGAAWDWAAYFVALLLRVYDALILLLALRLRLISGASPLARAPLARYYRQRRQGELERRLAEADTYGAFYEAALALDALEGGAVWKASRRDARRLYDRAALLQRLEQLAALYREGDIPRLMFCLRGCLSRDFCGIGRPELHRHSRVGTKRRAAAAETHLLQRGATCVRPHRVAAVGRQHHGPEPFRGAQGAAGAAAAAAGALRCQCRSGGGVVRRHLHRCRAAPLSGHAGQSAHRPAVLLRDLRPAPVVAPGAAPPGQARRAVRRAPPADVHARQPGRFHVSRGVRTHQAHHQRDGDAAVRPARIAQLPHRAQRVGVERGMCVGGVADRVRAGGAIRQGRERQHRVVSPGGHRRDVQREPFHREPGQSALCTARQLADEVASGEMRQGGAEAALLAAAGARTDSAPGAHAVPGADAAVRGHGHHHARRELGGSAQAVSQPDTPRAVAGGAAGRAPHLLQAR